MKHERLGIFAAAAVAVGAAAAFCRAPSVLFADAGEFLVAIAKSGVAHPPGFPLYLLLGGGFLPLTSWLPLPAASRLTLFSALCGGAAAGLLAVAADVLLARAGASIRPATRRILAVAAGFLGGFGPTLFDFSCDIEVYALHAVFLSGALAAALVAGGAEDARVRTRATLLAGLAAGGGLAVHHATMIVILPGLALLLWGADPGAERRRRAGVFLLGLVPGLATYAILPIRAARHPALNWGNPDSLPRFWEHVTAAIYQVNIESNVSNIAAHFGRFVESYRDELTAGGILLALAGALFALATSRARTAVAGLLVAIAGDVAFSVRYDIAEDQAAYYIPTFLATSLLCVLAAALVLERLAKRRDAFEAGGAAVFVLVVLVLSAWHLRSEAGRRHDRRAPEAAANLLASLPPGSLAFTPEWNLYAPAFGLMEVEGERPDVFLVDILLLRRGWYLDTLERTHPERIADVAAAFRAYRTKLADWEEHRPFDPDELTRLYDGFTRELTRAAWKRGAAVSWIGTLMTEHLPPGAALMPVGIAYRVLPSQAETSAYLPDAPVSFAEALRADQPNDPVFEEKVRPLESGMLTQRALYELAFSRSGDAKARVATARALSPGTPEPIEVAGDLLAAEGKNAEALALYAEAMGKGGDASRISAKSRSLHSPAPGLPSTLPAR